MEAFKVKKGVCMKEKGEEKIMDIRKGPWSVEEDAILIDYVATHGDRHWNSLARSSGLKRSGKSCRLRWLNYLRPNVRRGNITLEEQITILELHSRWGNRWSKIAEHLPGRTDNEIKNYWRTRVRKQAKQLNCDVNSEKFRDALRHLWIPLLLERLEPPSQLDSNPNPSGLHSSGSGKVCLNSSNSSSVQVQQLHSDSGQSFCSDQMGQNVSVHSGGNGPSLDSHMFEYNSGDFVLDTLWNNHGDVWVLPPLSDDDLGILKDNFFA